MEFEYPRNLRFECDRCTICCGDTTQRIRSILLMLIEAERISNHTGQKIEDFAEKIGPSQPYTHCMRKNSDGKCVFLSIDSCAIYVERPLVCRFYPFELKGSVGGKHVFGYTNECPCVGSGRKLTKRYFVDLFRQSRQTTERNRQFVSDDSF